MKTRRMARALAVMALGGGLCWPALLQAQIVTALVPDVGSTGEQVRIEGSGFWPYNPPPALTVRFRGPNLTWVTDTTAQRTSDSIIYAKVPSGAITGPILVQVGAGSYITTNDFTVVGLGPYISRVVPAIGGVSDQIKIYGWHLANANMTAPTVKFNGVTATDVVGSSPPSQLTVRVPNGATTGPLSVTTTYGTSNAPVPFTVVGAGPYISDFSPTVGNVNSLVSIEGVHFLSANATGAYFNGRQGNSFSVRSDTLIEVRVPSGATSGRISVSSSQGNFTNSTIFHMPPVFTGFSPVAGRAGTNVVLEGTNLLGTTAVLFGDTPAAFATPTNNNRIYAIAPTNGITAPVRINTVSGSYITNAFKYQPTISSFAPGAGTVGTPVTIYGANLNEGISSIVIGGASATPVNPAFGQVTANVPSGATNGPISVTTSNGTFTTLARFYLPPTISTYTPSAPPPLPGDTVTITGQNLLGATAVTFNGWPAQFTPPVNNTTLLAVVPTNVTTGPILVTTPGGIAASPRFYGVPVIDNFTPTHGLPGVGVTIRGTNFLDATSVRFNGTAAPILANNGGVIQTALPSGATTGLITVTAPAGTATSSVPFVVDFASDLNLAVSASPNPVFVTSNLVYWLFVTNAGPFDAPNVVLRDTLPASVTLRSNWTSRGSLNISGNSVVGQLGTLSISDSAVVGLVVAPTVVGQIINTVTVESGYPDLDPGDNAVTVTNFALPLPLLTMTDYSPSQWRIAWPLLLTNYQIEYGPGVGTNVFWSNLVTQPIIDGNEKFVIEANTEPSRMYRLVK